MLDLCGSRGWPITDASLLRDAGCIRTTMSKVQLYVYDLSNGMAKQMSLPLTGKQIDGIWYASFHLVGLLPDRLQAYIRGGVRKGDLLWTRD